MSTVLVTGAAGRIGGYLRSGLPGLGWTLRCLDLGVPSSVALESVSESASEPASESVSESDEFRWVVGDVADPSVAAEAVAGVDAVVHLAGIAQEAPFAELLHANIDGTYQVFEAAREAGVRRVIYASSNHAVGYQETGTPLTTAVRTRPDSFYGVSKVAGEALGSFYADRHGMDVAAVRIGSCFDRPPGVRALATWLSPGDSVRLVDALLRAPGFGFQVVYGISANKRAYWDLEPARALGYRPEDDAEVFAAELLAEYGPLADDHPDARLVGGRAATGQW